LLIWIKRNKMRNELTIKEVKKKGKPTRIVVNTKKEIEQKQKIKEVIEDFLLCTLIGLAMVCVALSIIFITKI